MVADDTEGEVVGRALDEDHVAGLREYGQHLVEGLGVAAADEHVAGGHRQALPGRRARGDRRAQRLRSQVRSVGERRGASGAERPRRRLPHEPDRQQRRVGLAEGELDEALAERVLGEGGRFAHAFMICEAPVREGRVVPRRTPAGGRPSLSLDWGTGAPHAVSHHHIRCLLSPCLRRQLAAHAQTAGLEAVHAHHQPGVLRLVGLALRPPAGAQRGRQPVLRALDRRHAARGRRPQVGPGGGGRRQPRRAGLVQVLRLLRHLGGQLPRHAPPERRPSAAAHRPAAGHLVPHLPGPQLRHRRVPRHPAAGVAARLLGVRRLLPVPGRRSHRPRLRVPAAAERPARPAQRGHGAGLLPHLRRPGQEDADRRLPRDPHRQRCVHHTGAVLVARSARRDHRVLGPDLLRLQRLRRHRHRRLPAARVRTARQLPGALHGEPRSRSSGAAGT